MNQVPSRKVAEAIAAALALSTLAAPSASAQQPEGDDVLDTVIVTGTRRDVPFLRRFQRLGRRDCPPVATCA